ncbi:MAG: 50S ribosomal protein L24 [Candidatus Niyogibacteria bacterium CG10_big_fil_rev_8_21_14_0_10_46_36]|uniref:Large ribosomal subunit protein uL24 n=1 Tax=Candidatus Niyogibacteria bacterium CG10_big_fil_rev_8_21_14_0_10_46_36 TaxID=1974726 RepID=A0A2H0TDY3_9BACT|nr:MAG: 50S ribosomal protein L24 [Candidatus Niyogibacteria bacterium CG10_big_fil_rev_8_21_14_0_10_46_36]
MTTAKLKIKKGDTVKVLSGKDKGKTGKVAGTFPKDERIIVENINMQTRHRRPRRQGQKGEKVSLAMPIHASNVLVVCGSCGKPTRIGYQVGQDKKKVRSCKKCKNLI